MPPCGHDLPRAIARHYDLPLQVSSFFALLILSECITDQSVACLGVVDARGLAHKLRRGLKDSPIKICSRRAVGYWLDDDTRRVLAKQFNIELGVSV